MTLKEALDLRALKTGGAGSEDGADTAGPNFLTDRMESLYMRFYVGGYDTDGSGGMVLSRTTIASVSLQPSTCDGCRPNDVLPTGFNECKDHPLRLAVCASAVDITNLSSPLNATIGTNNFMASNPSLQHSGCPRNARDNLYRFELQPNTVLRIAHNSTNFRSYEGGAISQSPGCPRLAGFDCEIDLNDLGVTLPKYFINREGVPKTAWYFVSTDNMAQAQVYLSEPSEKTFNLEWETITDIPLAPCAAAIDLASESSPIDSSSMPSAKIPDFNEMGCGRGAETFFQMRLEPNQTLTFRMQSSARIKFYGWAMDYCNDGGQTINCEHYEGLEWAAITNQDTYARTAFFFVTSYDADVDITGTYGNAYSDLEFNIPFTLEWAVTTPRFCDSAVDLTFATSPVSGSLQNHFENSIVDSDVDDDDQYYDQNGDENRKGCGQGAEKMYKIELLPNSTLTIGQESNNFDSVHGYKLGGECPRAANFDGCLNTNETAPVTMINSGNATTTAWFFVTRRDASNTHKAGDFVLRWSVDPPRPTPPPPPRTSRGKSSSSTATIVAVVVVVVVVVLGAVAAYKYRCGPFRNIEAAMFEAML